jgi:hypothetical protein
MENMNKEHETEIKKRIQEAGDPGNYVTEWDDKGIPKSKKKENVKRGGNSRARGARFELKIRKDLELKGRVVDKWTNNVDLDKDEIMIAKRKFNPYSKVMTIGTGFPDFISIKYIHDGVYSVIGVEVKMNGTLSKIEKEKCAWYLKNKIFSEIWIAKQAAPKGVPRGISPEMPTKGKRGEILYDDFREKYGGKFGID